MGLTTETREQVSRQGEAGVSGAHRTEAGEWVLGCPPMPVFQDHPSWRFVLHVSKLKHPSVQGGKAVSSHDGHWAQETGCSSMSLGRAG